MNDIHTTPHAINENWKVFRNTEAGILLAKLYGNKHQEHKKVKSFPSRNHRKTTENHQTPEKRWRYVNGKLGSEEPSNCCFDRKKARSVKAPSFHKTYHKEIAAIDTIPRRKSQNICSQEMILCEELRAHFRPGNLPCFSTNEEKDRLNDIFACKGGKSLPEELTMPIKETQKELAWRMKESQRISKARNLRQDKKLYSSDPGNEDNSRNVCNDKNVKNETFNRLFDHIVQEIKDRNSYQMEMEKYGSGEQTRDTIAKEIAARISRLMSLDKSRAIPVIASLQNK